MTLDGNDYVLSTGRRFYAHCGILGLSGRHPEDLYNGYDGVVWTEDPDGQPEDRPSFTMAERLEIAEHMIGLWRKWASPSSPKESES